MNPDPLAKIANPQATPETTASDAANALLRCFHWGLRIDEDTWLAWALPQPPGVRLGVYLTVWAVYRQQIGMK